MKVLIAKHGTSAVDAASILGLMTLGVQHGDEVLPTTDGEAAETALDYLAGLLARELDADSADSAR